MISSSKKWVKPFVVVVHTNRLFDEIASEFIEKQGKYRVLAVDTASRARETVNDLTHAAIFLVADQLPNITALELIPKLDEVTQFPIEWIVISGNGTKKLRGEVKRSGVDFYYIGRRPPYNVNELLLDFIRGAEKQLKKRVATERDPVTQAYTRSGGDQQAVNIWNRARRERTSTACIYGDLNNFKLVNDQFGHDAGDSVLRAVVAIIRHQIRSTDVIVRIGDEIYILCPETDSNDILPIMTRIRVEIAKALIEVSPGVNCMTSISLGWAVLHPENMTRLSREESEDVDTLTAAAVRDMSELMSLAEPRMYEDKLRHYEELVVTGVGDKEARKEARKKFKYYEKKRGTKQ
jgi:diguanylate cyclase (GGDEF)-like protein